MKSIMKIIYIVSLVCVFSWGLPLSDIYSENSLMGVNYKLAENLLAARSQSTNISESGYPEIPELLLNTLTKGIGRGGQLEHRISSSLQMLGKNLILESTRGTKEISLYRKVASAVVIVLTNNSFGSGSIINDKGHVITNWHVVKDYPDAFVVFKPKDSAELKKELAFTAHVERVDQVSDLALLKIIKPPKKFSYLMLGDSSSLAVGQDVHAVGHPRGEIWTYTKGFISQIRDNYEWLTSGGLAHRAKVIQTQTPINPGSSGGPLLDDQGELIGINAFLAQGEGLNYAVAVDEIKNLLQKKESKKITKFQPNKKPRCIEAYDTMGQGWKNIVGCYCASAAKRPELWLVYFGIDEPAEYAAFDSKGTGNIDTVIISEHKKWKSLWYFMDLNCDGIVELIGHQYAGEKEIDSYRYPKKSIPILEMAKELDAAIKKQKIPYPSLQICQ